MGIPPPLLIGTCRQASGAGFRLRGSNPLPANDQAGTFNRSPIQLGPQKWESSIHCKLWGKTFKILFCETTENTKNESFLCCSSLYIFSLKSLEASNINVGNQGVQFVGGVLVFVTHTCKANSASEGDISEKKEKHLLEWNSLNNHWHLTRTNCGSLRPVYSVNNFLSSKDSKKQGESLAKD